MKRLLSLVCSAAEHRTGMKQAYLRRVEFPSTWRFPAGGNTHASPAFLAGSPVVAFLTPVVFLAPVAFLTPRRFSFGGPAETRAERLLDHVPFSQEVGRPPLPHTS